MEDFQIPDAFLSKLRDLTGAPDKYQGFLLFCYDKNLEPKTIQLTNDIATVFALREAVRCWLNQMDEQHMFGPQDEEEP